MSLSCGAVLEMGMSRYAGKKQGELSLLRKMWAILSPHGRLDVAKARVRVQ